MTKFIFSKFLKYKISTIQISKKMSLIKYLKMVLAFPVNQENHTI